MCLGIVDLLAASERNPRSVSRMPDEDRGQQRIPWASCGQCWAGRGAMFGLVGCMCVGIADLLAASEKNPRSVPRMPDED